MQLPSRKHGCARELSRTDPALQARSSSCELYARYTAGTGDPSAPKSVDKENGEMGTSDRPDFFFY